MKKNGLIGAVLIAIIVKILFTCNKSSSETYYGVSNKEINDNLSRVLGKKVDKASDSEINVAWSNPAMFKIRNVITTKLVSDSFDVLDRIHNIMSKNSILTAEGYTYLRSHLKINTTLLKEIMNKYFEVKENLKAPPPPPFSQ